MTVEEVIFLVFVVDAPLQEEYLLFVFFEGSLIGQIELISLSSETLHQLPELVHHFYQVDVDPPQIIGVKMDHLPTEIVLKDHELVWVVEVLLLMHITHRAVNGLLQIH